MGASDKEPSEKTLLLGSSYENNRNDDVTSRSPSRSRSRARSGSYPQALTGALARSTSISRINTASLVPPGGSENDDTKVPSLWDSTRNQKLILVALFISNIFCFMCLAIMAPFFPKEAENKNMSTTVSGWVFAVFSLVQCFFAPVVGKLIPITGSRFLFLSGIFFGGGCTILFGFLDRVPITEDDNTVFTVLCFVLRIFLALGCTACATATFAIATHTFPDNAATAMGFLETAIGIGLMAGPALGGVIYGAGGFLAPFATVGITMILCVPLFSYILPAKDDGHAEEEPGSMLGLLKVPVIDMILVTIVVSALLWVSLDPILEPQLRQFDLNSTQVGLVFLLLSGTYAFLAPLCGRLADRMDNSTPLMIAGFAVLTVGLLLLGPSPLIGLESYNTLWLTLVSLVILGVGVSLTIVPTYDKILTSAEQAGIPSSMGTHGAVAGLWTSIYALGEFIGPIYGGAAFESIGFSWAMTIIAMSTFAMLLLTIFIYIYERSVCSKRCEWRYSHLLSEND